MKKILIAIITLAIACVAIACINSSAGRALNALVRKGNINVSHLRFKVYLFGLLPVGELKLENKGIEEYDAQRVYHLGAEAKTLDYLSPVFKASAMMDSYVAEQGLYPLAFRERMFISGRANAEKEIIYDQKNNYMSIGGIKRQIPPATQDYLSAIFNLQRADFSQSDEISLTINTNQKNYSFSGRVYPKVFYSNRKGYKVFLINAEVKRKDKNPYHKSVLSFALLETESGNIPILIKVFAQGAFINIKLVDTR